MRGKWSFRWHLHWYLQLMRLQSILLPCPFPSFLKKSQFEAISHGKSGHSNSFKLIHEPKYQNQQISSIVLLLIWSSISSWPHQTCKQLDLTLPSKTLTWPLKYEVCKNVFTTTRRQPQGETAFCKCLTEWAWWLSKCTDYLLYSLNS